tara:strand:+ start:71 stop:577 length:507 start_codon:yes stop_codon:yes gene_type:complete
MCRPPTFIRNTIDEHPEFDDSPELELTDVDVLPDLEDRFLEDVPELTAAPNRFDIIRDDNDDEIDRILQIIRSFPALLLLSGDAPQTQVANADNVDALNAAAHVLLDNSAPLYREVSPTADSSGYVLVNLTAIHTAIIGRLQRILDRYIQSEVLSTTNAGFDSGYNAI